MEATLKFISWVRDTACHMVPRYLDVGVAANWLWGSTPGVPGHLPYSTGASWWVGWLLGRQIGGVDLVGVPLRSVSDST